MDKNLLDHVQGWISDLLSKWKNNSRGDRGDVQCFDMLGAQSLLRRCIPTPEGDALLRTVEEIIDKRGLHMAYWGCRRAQKLFAPHIIQWTDEWVKEINTLGHKESYKTYLSVSSMHLFQAVDELELFHIAAKEMDYKAAKEIAPQVRESVEYFNKHFTVLSGTEGFFRAWKNTIRPDLHQVHPELEGTLDKFFPVFQFLENKGQEEHLSPELQNSKE